MHETCALPPEGNFGVSTHQAPAGGHRKPLCTLREACTATPSGRSPHLCVSCSAARRAREPAQLTPSPAWAAARRNPTTRANPTPAATSRCAHHLSWRRCFHVAAAMDCRARCCSSGRCDMRARHSRTSCYTSISTGRHARAKTAHVWTNVLPCRRVQVLGLGTDTGDSAPSVLLFFDHYRFLFNAGEGFQRFCVQHRIRMGKTTAIFGTPLHNSGARWPARYQCWPHVTSGTRSPWRAA